MSPASVIFDLVAALVAVLLVWDRIKLKRRCAELIRRCEEVQLENLRLHQALSVRESGEVERLSRLEHDLRSTISVINGFSALIQESAEKDLSPSPSFLLKGASAIQQSTAKALRILEAAGQDQHTEQRKGLALEENR
jgi:hypothetical protein